MKLFIFSIRCLQLNVVYSSEEEELSSVPDSSISGLGILALGPCPVALPCCRLRLSLYSACLADLDNWR